MSTFRKHIRMNYIDESGNINIFYPESKGEDVLIGVQNANIPHDVTNAQQLANKLAKSAFESPVNDSLTDTTHTWSSNNINGKFTTVNNNITTINGNITTINGNITTINSNINTINGKLPFSLAISSGAYGYKTTNGTFVAFRLDSTDTWRFPAGSTGSTVELPGGTRNIVRYVNAENVYTKGSSDGYSNGYNNGYTAGKADGNTEGSASAMVGTAKAEHVLTGKTYTSTEGIGKSGSMPDRSSTIHAAVTTTSNDTVSCYRTNGTNIEIIPAKGYWGSYYNSVTNNWDKEKITIKVQTNRSVTASRSNQTVTPNDGSAYLTQVVVNKFPDANGTYNCPSNWNGTPANGGNGDMGADNNKRLVNAAPVYTTGYNAGYTAGVADGKTDHKVTYHFTDADATKAKNDQFILLGQYHNYKDIDAKLAYTLGKSDGYGEGYDAGYNKNTSPYVTFTHHVHSTTSSSKTVTDSNPTTTGSYGGTTNSSKGGCYQTETNFGYAYKNPEKSGSGGDGSWWQYWECGRCHTYMGNCGQEAGGSPQYNWVGLGPGEWPSDPSKVKHNCSDHGYKTTCGYTAGQVISGDIREDNLYDDLK